MVSWIFAYLVGDTHTHTHTRHEIPPPKLNKLKQVSMLLHLSRSHTTCRPTIFIEIIQRVGCMMKNEEGRSYQKGGCGGFGKGNFSELFKSIEEYEKTLEAKQTVDSATV